MIRLDTVRYSYPQSTSPAVDGVSLAVKPGELVLCTGRSGCGKSTLVRLMNGLAPHYHNGVLEGSVMVNGINNRGRSLTAISMDAGTLFQNPETQFFALTVEDEASVSLECRGVPEEQCRSAVRESLCELGLESIANRSVLYLSEGQKQKVALAGLLALAPKALILDEPTANLDPESAKDLALTLTRLKNKGFAIFVADHRLAWLRDAADRVLVMEQGAIVAQGSFSLLDDAALRARHGLRNTHWDDPRNNMKTVPASAPDALGGLNAHNLSFSFRNGPALFDSADVYFPKGGITALVGPNGCGKTTLARLCAGLLKSKTANFAWGSDQLHQRHLPRRVGLVLQNADHQLRMHSVRAELADSLAGLPDEEREKRIDAVLAEYGLVPLAKRHPQSLSGGEKQRLSVAAAMVRRPDTIFLDEPTSGLDGENMRRMGQDLRRAAENGAAIVVITHDLEFMGTVCDHRLVLPLASPDAGNQ